VAPYVGNATVAATVVAGVVVSALVPFTLDVIDEWCAHPCASAHAALTG